MDEHAFPLGKEGPGVIGCAPRVVELRVHEVRDDLDRPAHAELARGDVAEVPRDRRDRVALLDPPAGDRQIGAVLPHQRDVGSVQGRQDLQSRTPLSRLISRASSAEIAWGSA